MFVYLNSNYINLSSAGWRDGAMTEWLDGWLAGWIAGCAKLLNIQMENFLRKHTNEKKSTKKRRIDTNLIHHTDK